MGDLAEVPSAEEASPASPGELAADAPLGHVGVPPYRSPLAGVPRAADVAASPLAASPSRGPRVGLRGKAPGLGPEPEVQMPHRPLSARIPLSARWVEPTAPPDHTQLAEEHGAPLQTPSRPQGGDRQDDRPCL
eukprot:6857387-Pyramimonas_sp.AAC.1